jgi:hypothetical protein
MIVALGSRSLSLVLRKVLSLRIRCVGLLELLRLVLVRRRSGVGELSRSRDGRLTILLLVDIVVLSGNWSEMRDWLVVVGHRSGTGRGRRVERRGRAELIRHLSLRIRSLRLVRLS